MDETITDLPVTPDFTETSETPEPASEPATEPTREQKIAFVTGLLDRAFAAAAADAEVAEAEYALNTTGLSEEALIAARHVIDRT